MWRIRQTVPVQDHGLGGQPVDGPAIERAGRAALGQHPGDVALDPGRSARDLGGGGGGEGHVGGQGMARVFLARALGAALFQHHDVLGEQGQDSLGVARPQGGMKGVHDGDGGARRFIIGRG